MSHLGPSRWSAPLETSEDLLDYFRQSEKPTERWLIGTEHEKLGFRRSDHGPLPYGGPNGIEAILKSFMEQFGWLPVMEGENLIALNRGAANISLEPGGQFELSGEPLLTAHDTCRELNGHINELRMVSDALGVEWMTLGHHPVNPKGDLHWMPKERYAIMGQYLPTRGSMALDMMLCTGTVQTNLDYADEADMAAKMRLAVRLAPFFTAMYANSPFAAGKPSGYLSTRARIWMDTDPDRCGVPPAFYKADFGYADYVKFALDAPMFFIHRDGHYLNYAGRSFREFMAEGFDGHVATQEDWVLHLTTVFPDARLKNIIELRMADVGSLPMICSLPALTRGLFYDATALRSVTELLEPLEPQYYPKLQLEAARFALRAQAGGRAVREWARDILEIASGGLKRLHAVNSSGEDERKFLKPLFQILETGKTNADLLLEHWEGDWNRRLEPLFSEEMML